MEIPVWLSNSEIFRRFCGLPVVRHLIAMDLYGKLCALVQSMNPIAGFLLAALESIFPPIPLAAVAALNVAGFGAVGGFLLTWAGTCLGSTAVFLLFERLGGLGFIQKFLGGKKIRKAVQFVGSIDRKTLFFIIMLPFTPGSFVNFAFGITRYDRKKFLQVLWPAKALMVGSLSLFGEAAVNIKDHPAVFIAALAGMVVLYAASREVEKKHGL